MLIKPPSWFGDKLKFLAQTGKLDISGEAFDDLSFIGSRPSMKQLDLSFTPILTIEGLQLQPKLDTLIADSSELANFKNFRAVQKISSISIRNTPVSHLPNYKLSLLIVIGPSLRVINGQYISPKLREKAKQYPPIASDLINCGWIVEYPCPDDKSLQKISQSYGLLDNDEDLNDNNDNNQELADFKKTVDYYTAFHNKIIQQAHQQIQSASLDIPSDSFSRHSISKEASTTRNESFLSGLESDFGLNLCDKVQILLHHYGYTIDPKNRNESMLSIISDLLESDFQEDFVEEEEEEVDDFVEEENEADGYNDYEEEIISDKNENNEQINKIQPTENENKTNVIRHTRSHSNDFNPQREKKNQINSNEKTINEPPNENIKNAKKQQNDNLNENPKNIKNQQNDNFSESFKNTKKQQHDDDISESFKNTKKQQPNDNLSESFKNTKNQQDDDISESFKNTKKQQQNDNPNEIFKNTKNQQDDDLSESFKNNKNQQNDNQNEIFRNVKKQQNNDQIENFANTKKHPNEIQTENYKNYKKRQTDNQTEKIKIVKKQQIEIQADKIKNTKKQQNDDSSDSFKNNKQQNVNQFLKKNSEEIRESQFQNNDQPSYSEDYNDDEQYFKQHNENKQHYDNKEEDSHIIQPKYKITQNKTVNRYYINSKEIPNNTNNSYDDENDYNNSVENVNDSSKDKNLDDRDYDEDMDDGLDIKPFDLNLYSEEEQMNTSYVEREFNKLVNNCSFGSKRDNEAEWNNFLKQLNSDENSED